jgi:hypothetical protein
MISTNQGLESYIGKSIFDYPNAILEYEESNVKIFGIQEKLLFFQKSYSYLHLKTDDHNIILSVSFMIEKIDKTTFDKMVLEYGVPDEMFKMGKVYNNQYSENADYIAKTIQGVAESCDFYEDPIFIIWRKKEFKLTISQHTDNWYSHMHYEKIVR